MRPEELVRRAEQHIDAGEGHVDWSVRRVVDSVYPRERARLVRELDDALDRCHRADRVRSPREGDDGRSRAEQPLDIGKVE